MGNISTWEPGRGVTFDRTYDILVQEEQRSSVDRERLTPDWIQVTRSDYPVDLKPHRESEEQFPAQIAVSPPSSAWRVLP